MFHRERVKRSKQVQSSILFTKKRKIEKVSSNLSLSVHTSDSKSPNISRSHSISSSSSSSKPLFVPSTSQKTELSKYDIATYHDKANCLEPSEIFDLIKNVYTPSDQNVFSKNNGRSFRAVWLEKYPYG